MGETADFLGDFEFVPTIGVPLNLLFFNVGVAASIAAWHASSFLNLSEFSKITECSCCW